MLPGESVELELEGETIHHYEPATRPDRGHHSTTEYCYWVLKPGQEYTGFTVETSDCELEGGLWTITAEEGAADVGEQCLEFVRYCMEGEGGDHEEEEEEEEEEEDHDWWWFGSEGPGRKNRDRDNEDQDNEDQDNEDQDNEDGDGDHEDGDGDHSALTLKVRVRIFEGSDENNDEEENNDDEQLP